MADFNSLRDIQSEADNGYSQGAIRRWIDRDRGASAIYTRHNEDESVLRRLRVASGESREMRSRRTATRILVAGTDGCTCDSPIGLRYHHVRAIVDDADLGHGLKPNRDAQPRPQLDGGTAAGQR